MWDSLFSSTRGGRFACHFLNFVFVPTYYGGVSEFLLEWYIPFEEANRWEGFAGAHTCFTASVTMLA